MASNSNTHKSNNIAREATNARPTQGQILPETKSFVLRYKNYWEYFIKEKKQASALMIARYVEGRKKQSSTY